MGQITEYRECSRRIHLLWLTDEPINRPWHSPGNSIAFDGDVIHEPAQIVSQTGKLAAVLGERGDVQTFIAASLVEQRLESVRHPELAHHDMGEQLVPLQSKRSFHGLEDMDGFGRRVFAKH
ncbi:hypothetical protein [Stakelama marina]|uniref:Uncharacterized protein n=1 Tax=Stakelama marina TaxID=2826939 RepID=A0A8T4II64_9SPHN|nr:hypothetical protein [Stakelama marina]MBR0553732.1 hypothetical protein [Stakelama marina]